MEGKKNSAKRSKNPWGLTRAPYASKGRSKAAFWLERKIFLYFSARSMSPVCFLCSYEQLDVLHLRYLSNRYQRWSQIDITFVAWPEKGLYSLRAFNKFTKNERQRTDYVQNALLPYKKDFWKPFCCSWSVGKHCLWNYFHRGLVSNLCGLGFRFPS